jgi:hypothetical protein
MQNGIDAIRKAIKRGEIGKTEGRFEVNYERSGAENWRLSFVDNGVGMDLDDIQSKFLVLGGTGKGNDAGAVGGFGVAKAVILGCSSTGKWNLHSRDNQLSSDILGRESSESELKTSRRQGTELKLDDVKFEYSTRDTIQEYLGTSNVPGIELSINGNPVSYALEGKRKTTVKNTKSLNWGTGNSCEVKSYKRPGLSDRGRCIIRVNGLTQWIDPLYDVNKDIVFDLTVSARPGTEDYPFNKGRDGFRGEAYYAYQGVRENLAKDTISGAEEEQWDTSLYLDRKEQTEPENRGMIDQQMSEIAAIIEKAPEFIPEIKPSNDKERSVVELLQEVADLNNPSIGGVKTLAEVAFRTKRVEQSTGDTDQVKVIKGNFDKQFLVKRNRKTYKGKFNVAKRMKMLFAWDYVFKSVWQYVEDHDKTDSLYPGFILDKTDENSGGTVAMNTQEEVYVDGRYETRRYVLLNPFEYDGLESKPRQMAHDMISIACHELAHNKYHGHNESFSSYREHLQRKAAPIYDQIVNFVESMYGKKQPDRAAGKKAVAAKAEKKQRRRERIEVAGIKPVTQVQQMSLF